MRSLLLLSFGLLPFQWALSPVEGVDLALVRVLSLFIGAFWLGRGLIRKRLLIPEDPILIFFLSFLFLASVSFLWAENDMFVLRKALFFLSFAPLLFVLLSWFREYPQERAAFIKVFVAGAATLGFLSICLFFLQFVFGVERLFALLTQEILPFFLGQSFGQTVASYPSLLVNVSGVTLLRASGVFPDPHMFSFYVGMAAPLALVLFSQEKKRRWLWFSACGILVLADLLSFSRGGYVGLLFGGTILSLEWVRRFSWDVKRLGLLFVALSIFGIVMTTTPLGSRALSIFSHEDGSNRERFRLFEEALIHVTERPFLGVGLGNYPLLVKPGAEYREPIYAHDLYLDIAVDLGLVGLALFLGMIGLAAFSLWQQYRKTHDFLALALLASLGIFCGHSFFETALFSVHVFPALLLLLSLGVSYRQYEA